MLAAKTKLLGYARDAEWLTRKSATEDVVGRNVRDRHFMDIAMWTFPEIRLVRLLAKLIIVRGEDASSTGPLEGNPETPNSTEEVDEAEGNL